MDGSDLLLGFRDFGLFPGASSSLGCVACSSVVQGGLGV